MTNKKRSLLLGLFFLLSVLYLRVAAAPLADTLANYFALRIYNGSADTVYLEHERYYGFFVRDTCSEEDFGTRILTNSGCWRRLANNYSPRFWQLGGPSPDNQIGNIIEEIDAINSAAIAAYRVGGDTIEIDSIYQIDRSVYLLSGNTYWGTSDSSGFRRRTPPYTILTDTAKLGDEKIRVANNAGFRTLQKINIADGVAFDSVAGHISYTASIAYLLGGDSTIFLSGRDIQRQMLPGDSVSLFFPMMTPRYTDLDSVYLQNLIFDGNRMDYRLNYDWRINATIQLTTTNEALIEHCRFYNIPVENVFLCGAVFKDCSGMDLNGSAVHFSCNDFDHPTEILYNRFSGTNTIGNAITNHSEAGFTFSAKVQNLRIAYNEMDQIGEHGVGIFKNDDSFNEITDNLLNSALATIAFQDAYLYPETNLIYNNKNLNFADTSEADCWLRLPQLTDSLACQGNSSWEEPLALGDTLTLHFDTLQLRNTNENYLKAIVPHYQQDFFELDAITLATSNRSVFHDWVFTETPTAEKALVFDNGHRDGIYETGNWGFEPCSLTGGCTALSFRFIVRQLPDTTSRIACPLSSIDFLYDGETNTWNQAIHCSKSPLLLDSNLLGSPVLIGDINTSNILFQQTSDLEILPNPAQDFIYVKGADSAGMTYRIVNLLGHIVQQGPFIDSGIPVHALAQGMYYLQLASKDMRYTKPFVKR